MQVGHAVISSLTLQQLIVKGQEQYSDVCAMRITNVLCGRQA